MRDLTQAFGYSVRVHNGGSERVAFHHDYDRLYFTGDDWATRAQSWLANEKQAGNHNPFLDGNERLIRQTLEHRETG